MEIALNPHYMLLSIAIALYNQDLVMELESYSNKFASSLKTQKQNLPIFFLTFFYNSWNRFIKLVIKFKQIKIKSIIWFIFLFCLFAIRRAIFNFLFLFMIWKLYIFVHLMLLMIVWKFFFFLGLNLFRLMFIFK